MTALDVPSTSTSHKQWCDPARCDDDRAPDGFVYDTYHRSAPLRWQGGVPGLERDDADFSLFWMEPRGSEEDDESTKGLLSINIEGEIGTNDIDSLIVWLTAVRAQLSAVVR